MVIWTNANSMSSTTSDLWYCGNDSTGGTFYWPTWHDQVIIPIPPSSLTTVPYYYYYWPTWHDQVIPIAAPAIIRERTTAEEARQAEYRRHAAELAEQRKAAVERAKQILLEHLTPQQREMVEKRGWFVIRGGQSGKLYRVRSNAIAGNIEELDAAGSAVARYCCHLTSDLPHPDHHLAQKLMLEWDEKEFLRLANRIA